MADEAQSTTPRVGYNVTSTYNNNNNNNIKFEEKESANLRPKIDPTNPATYGGNAIKSTSQSLQSQTKTKRTPATSTTADSGMDLSPTTSTPTVATAFTTTDTNVGTTSSYYNPAFYQNRSTGNHFKINTNNSSSYIAESEERNAFIATAGRGSSNKSISNQVARNRNRDATTESQACSITSAIDEPTTNKSCSSTIIAPEQHQHPHQFTDHHYHCQQEQQTQDQHHHNTNINSANEPLVPVVVEILAPTTTTKRPEVEDTALIASARHLEEPLQEVEPEAEPAVAAQLTHPIASSPSTTTTATTPTSLSFSLECYKDAVDIAMANYMNQLEKQKKALALQQQQQQQQQHPLQDSSLITGSSSIRNEQQQQQHLPQQQNTNTDSISSNINNSSSGRDEKQHQRKKQRGSSVSMDTRDGRQKQQPLLSPQLSAKETSLSKLSTSNTKGELGELSNKHQQSVTAANSSSSSSSATKKKNTPKNDHYAVPASPSNSTPISDRVDQNKKHQHQRQINYQDKQRQPNVASPRTIHNKRKRPNEQQHHQEQQNIYYSDHTNEKQLHEQEQQQKGLEQALLLQFQHQNQERTRRNVVQGTVGASKPKQLHPLQFKLQQQQQQPPHQPQPQPQPQSQSQHHPHHLHHHHLQQQQQQQQQQQHQQQQEPNQQNINRTDASQKVEGRQNRTQTDPISANDEKDAFAKIGRANEFTEERNDDDDGDSDDDDNDNDDDDDDFDDVGRPLAKNYKSNKRSNNNITNEKYQNDDQGDDTLIPWTPELHRLLVEAIYEIGLSHASPAVIMEHMIYVNLGGIGVGATGSQSAATATAAAAAATSAFAGNSKSSSTKPPLTASDKTSTSTGPAVLNHRDSIGDESIGTGAAGGDNNDNEGNPITSERVKSHLQKYRKNKIKSKDDFMSQYDSWLQKAYRSSSSALDNNRIGGVSAVDGPVISTSAMLELMSNGDGICMLLGGDLPAFLSWAVMEQEKQENDPSSKVSNIVPMARNKNSTVPGASAMGDVGDLRNDRRSEASSKVANNAYGPDDRQHQRQVPPASSRPSQPTGNSHTMAGKKRTLRPEIDIYETLDLLSGASIPLPVLTEEEQKSSLGVSITHVVGLFHSMTRHLMEEREAKTGDAETAANTEDREDPDLRIVEVEPIQHNHHDGQRRSTSEDPSTLLLQQRYHHSTAETLAAFPSLMYHHHNLTPNGEFLPHVEQDQYRAAMDTAAHRLLADFGDRQSGMDRRGLDSYPLLGTARVPYSNHLQEQPNRLYSQHPASRLLQQQLLLQRHQPLNYNGPAHFLHHNQQISTNPLDPHDETDRNLHSGHLHPTAGGYNMYPFRDEHHHVRHLYNAAVDDRVSSILQGGESNVAVQHAQQQREPQSQSQQQQQQQHLLATARRYAAYDPYYPDFEPVDSNQK